MMGGVQTGAVSGSYLRSQDRADDIAEAEVTILKEFRTQIVIDDVDVIGADMTFEAEIHGSGDGEWFEVGDITINGYGAESGRGRDLVLKRAEVRPGDRPAVGLKAELYRLCEAVVRAARKSVGDDLAAEEAENRAEDPEWPR